MTILSSFRMGGGSCFQPHDHRVGILSQLSEKKELLKINVISLNTAIPERTRFVEVPECSTCGGF